MPLTFDLPLEQLKTYQGINPRPADYDAYWERALAELDGVDPRVELIPAEFQTPFAECFHLYFTGVGGARVYAKLLRPRRAPEPHPAVVMFHGYTGNSGDWSEKLGYVAQGYTVAALDCRGQGGLSEDRGGVKGWTLNGHIVRGLDDDPDRMLYRQIFLDTAQLARIVMGMPEVDAARVGATGLSQGGALTLVCAALEPRIKLVAPVFPFLCDFKRVWAIDLARDAYKELHDWFRRFDPRHEREEELFTRLGYIDVQHLAPRIRGEVRMAVGLMDQICPPSTQFAAYNKITAKKSMVIYPDYGHEGLPGDSDGIFQFLTGLLAPARLDFILASIRDIVEDIGDRLHDPQTALQVARSSVNPETSTEPDTAPLHLLCQPARDLADEIAAAMLAQLLEARGYQVQINSHTTLVGEVLDHIASQHLDLVCVSALPPMADLHARYLCKRLRRRFPRLKIIVGLWTLQDDPRRALERIGDRCTDRVVTSIAQAMEVIDQLAPSLRLQEPEPTAPDDGAAPASVAEPPPLASQTG